MLDPFGGSGVTAIEAFLSNRHGIHNDINPLGNFIAQQIADMSHGSTDYIRRAYDAIDSQCGNVVRGIYAMSDTEVQRRLRRTRLPENIELPKNSDAQRFYDLFTPRQLLALALLKEAIESLRDRAATGQLLLAWSATLAKLNRTFLSAKGRLESRGGSSIFSIYRYKVAKRPVELPPWETFTERLANVINAKEEILRELRYLELRGGFHGRFESYGKDVLDLPAVLEKADYIFTDPPYGGHIAYLDLSTIWNHWLGFSVPAEIRQREIIVGGEMGKSEEEYLSQLRKSIKACVNLLKKNRWMSVVFQHWNVAYFEAILEAAEDSGANLRSAVTQVGNTIWSMHKKKGRERILAGEMILTFFNDGKRKGRAAKNHIDIERLIDIALPAALDSEGHLCGELLFNRLIVEAWQRNALHALRIARDDFLGLLERKGWRYDPAAHYWTGRRPESTPAAKLW